MLALTGSSPPSPRCSSATLMGEFPLRYLDNRENLNPRDDGEANRTVVDLRYAFKRNKCDQFYKIAILNSRNRNVFLSLRSVLNMEPIMGFRKIFLIFNFLIVLSNI